MTKKLLLSFGGLFMFFLYSPAANTSETLLSQLDHDIAMNAVFTMNKEEEIRRLKNNLQLAVLPTDKYLSCEQIAVAYSLFDSDSALFYYQKCHDYGSIKNNKAWMDNATIKQAFIYAERGDNFISFNKLQQAGDIIHIYPDLREEYAKAMMNNYVRSTSTVSKNFNKTNAEAAWQIYGKYIPENSPSFFVYYSIAHPDYDARNMIEDLQRRLAKTPPHSVGSATLHMQLFLAYLKLGKQEEALCHIIQAADDDVRCCNKSSSSLLRLIEFMNQRPPQKNKLTRLKSYLEVCMENVNRFRDVGRSIHVVAIQKQILNKYQEMTQHNYRLLTLLFIVITSTLVILSVVVWRQRRTLLQNVTHSKVLFDHIEELNQTLAQQELTLSATEAQLAEAKTRNEKFDGVMARQFGLLSMFLKDIKTYKRDLANLIASGQTKEARKLTNAGVMKDHTTNAFYDLFDKNFLFVHPDFVPRFNAVMRPESRIVPEKKDMLTPELRIYALISLGIDDSRNIAEILQYSIQTVYNYRLKVRHGCLEDKFNIDDYIAGRTPQG